MCVSVRMLTISPPPPRARLAVEFAHLTLSPRTGKPQPRIFTAQDIDRLLEREGLAKPKDPEDIAEDPVVPAAVAGGAAPAVSGSRGGEGMNVD